jgi:alkaline phosphatase D
MRRLAVFAILALPLAGSDFRSNWSRIAGRDGIGPEYQAKPPEAWRILHGRLECSEESGDRSVLLLTRELADRRATVRMSVRLGRLEPKSVSPDGWVGFRLGLREGHSDGLHAGITSDGKLFIGAPEEGTPLVKEPLDNLKLSLEWVQGWLSIEVNQIRVSKNLARSDTTGGIALVCGSGAGRFWFRDWTLSGSRVDDRKDRTSGLTNSGQQLR